MDNNELLQRIQYLISKGEGIKETKFSNRAGRWCVDYGLFNGFRTACLSFIGGLYGTDSMYYNDFDSKIDKNYLSAVSAGLGIMNSIKDEVVNGWLQSYQSLVRAEVFSDFLEMSSHLLNEGYEDAAAVMIGSILENHLRQLCTRWKVDIDVYKGDDAIPKKADQMNMDLKKSGAYNQLDQKQIIAWLGLRNSAAHGKYEEYTFDQVRLMHQGVADFIARTN